jgi:hypothetical protein
MVESYRIKHACAPPTASCRLGDGPHASNSLRGFAHMRSWQLSPSGHALLGPHATVQSMNVGL